jgi:shikimate kinase
MGYGPPGREIELADMLGADSIFLVGPMGSGKSTIGRLLARHIDKEFHDSDKEIEERTGASIPLIFEIEGEDGFRQRERQVIEDLTLLANVVVATGGGAVIDPANRECLKHRGLVIYLHAPVERLYLRTRWDRNRPLLQAPHPRRKLEELVQQREPLYREVADAVIETDGRTTRQVIDDICQAWRRP